MRVGVGSGSQLSLDTLAGPRTFRRASCFGGTVPGKTVARHFSSREIPVFVANERWTAFTATARRFELGSGGPAAARPI
jgi:hypothetical protein